MTRLHRLAVAVLCLCALAVFYCPGVAARFSESRSLFRDAFEVVDINSTSLRELHESAHMCPWILVTYLDSCGHCRHSAPLVARIAEETLEDSGDVLNEVTVAALNCETSMHDCHELRVVGVPSFYFLFPSDMPVNATTLEPVVANKNLLDKGNVEAKPINMTRALIGQGANPNAHFNTARKMWTSASTNLWRATNKELCLHMRTYLRNSKESDAAEAGAGGVLPTASTSNFVEETTFHVVDVANAFFETLFHEVALKGLESAARRRALFRFLRLVQQRLPGLGADVLLYSMTVNRRVDGAQSSVADFASSVGDWQKLVLSAGIPYQGTPRHLSWRTCKGSSWRYRGFPCGMWLLYHSLTVNAARVDADELTAGVADDNNTEVLFIILDYARHFFACDACLTHFLRFQPGDKDPVLQLWRFHNEVNRRLASLGEGGDPLVPKRIFPTVEQCPACIRDDVTGKEEDRFVEAEVSKYLRSRYKWNPEALHEGTVRVTESTTKRSINDHGGAINVYHNLLSMDTFLTIVLVIVAAVLCMVYVLRRHHSSAAKRRRPILPLRARD
ncbi:putative quiescin sulfhydryl oxidase [Leishmania infantum JPCM5]|uniref:Sulfhydryl oxidase n=2 Tax=Leishmania infantum TaxID=5671 RepID=A0A6L0XLH8_LEIIN|nr:putative quiescin sulfhydryl oxidase [Leishmania infantum JPCM5]CAC9511938.1 quiescin_sulfhydryl_oxidase_-_putative [Leishmania infantum]CAM69939.1 putative quiescin sulfhydryl oxidase [Leishmania infantum JPCM5]SUZ43857.1 quiescin_sulfhydryl_oxidase_-_putative [Leishmania infantum]|eukprot:XP_001466890.1 putative quiescin sulfhydryl oxidase [Leishmania infantum JPCM5]